MLQLQLGDQPLDRMDPVEPTRTADAASVRLKIGERTWEVTFHTHGELGGHLRLTGGDQPIDRPLATAVTPQVGILATPE